MSAWNLFRTLTDLQDTDAAAELLKKDLLWLKDQDPEKLGAEQRQIREFVIDQIGRLGIS